MTENVGKDKAFMPGYQMPNDFPPHLPAASPRTDVMGLLVGRSCHPGVNAGAVKEKAA